MDGRGITEAFVAQPCRRRLLRLFMGRRVFVAVISIGVLIGASSVAAAMITRSLVHPETVRPVVSFASGVVQMGNSIAGSAVVSRSKMVPGDTVSGQVIISNGGVRAAEFHLYARNLIDTPGPAGGRLSQRLMLRIKRVGRVSARRATVYNGVFRGLKSASLGRFAPHESRRYVFTVAFPVGTSALDSTYMASSMSVRFDWSTSVRR
jgi:hypothetical protein